MHKATPRREKWILSFDARLKNVLIKESRKRGVYPVTLLEQIVRERFNPYSHTDIEDSVAYIREIRKGSRSQSDNAFLEEIRAWQSSNSWKYILRGCS